MEEQALKTDLQNMDNRLTELEEKLDKIDVKLTQVIEAIKGNPLTKVGGLVSDMESMKTRISEIEKKQIENDEFKKRVYWTVGIIVAAALIFQYITSVYVNIKK